MTTFVITVILVLAIWGACSFAEATIYAVRLSYVRQLVDDDVAAGRILLRFKENMEHPVSAILIINTAVSAAGAAIAGAQVSELFGEKALIWFSIGFTIAALFLAEIIPKLLGVAFHRRLAPLIALPLLFLVKLLYPLVWLTELSTRMLMPSQPVLAAPEEEVAQFALISAEEGSIMPHEAELVHNVLQLDQLTAREIMTPRPVVTKLPDDLTLQQTIDETKQWTFSRIPVYDRDDPDTWTGFVLTREILSTAAGGEPQTTLKSMSKPLYFVSDQTPGHVLLKAFLRRRTHLFGVSDEFGAITGIVTLEDVFESLIGEEIVDESDIAVDMQEVALLRKRENSSDGDLQ